MFFHHSLMAKPNLLQKLRLSLSLLHIQSLLVMIFCPNTLAISIPPNWYLSLCLSSSSTPVHQLRIFFMTRWHKHVTYHRHCSALQSFCCTVRIFTSIIYWHESFTPGTPAHCWHLRVQQPPNYLHWLSTVFLLGVLLFLIFFKSVLASVLFGMP